MLPTFQGLLLIHFLKPLVALQHPTFERMINIAARATKKIALPGRKVTRAKILDMFKTQMRALSDRLNVSHILVYTYTKTHLPSEQSGQRRYQPD